MAEYDNNEIELYLDSNSRSSGELADTELDQNIRGTSRHYTLSPESMDYDSNCGDLDSLSNDIHVNGGSVGGGGGSVNISVTDYARLYTSMPILEDGLSSGHASDTEKNNYVGLNTEKTIESPINDSTSIQPNNDELLNDTENAISNQQRQKTELIESSSAVQKKNDAEVEDIFLNNRGAIGDGDVEATLRDIRTTLQRTKTLLGTSEPLDIGDRDKSTSPIWIPRYLPFFHNNFFFCILLFVLHRHLKTSQESINSDAASKPLSPDEEEADTDLETDRLLGQQRLDDQIDDNVKSL